MRCPACEVVIQLPVKGTSEAYPDADPDNPHKEGYDVAHGFCPNCGRFIVVLRTGRYWEHEDGRLELMEVWREEVVHPPGKAVRTVEPEVPARYGKDFSEAAEVLSY